jgi:hypothetical protein
MSTEIVQFIPRPKRGGAQTDFPTIAFRSTTRDPKITHPDSVALKHAAPANRET